MNADDRDLIAWAAHAATGDVVPAPYGSNVRVVERLVELGVMAEPAIGESSETFCVRATEAARAWLARERLGDDE